MWNVNQRPLSKLGKMEKGINRNIVECKYVIAASLASAISELIETLWNVNIAYSICSVIDLLGINRNIVECKSLCRILFHVCGDRINRNIVECKCVFKVEIAFYLIGINRNIVECK